MWIHSHYQIAVVKLPTDSLPTRSPDDLFPDQNSFINYTEANRITSRPVAYIAAEFAASLFPPDGRYIIGEDSQPNDRKRLYTNALLEVGKMYTCFLRAYPVNTNVSQLSSTVHMHALPVSHTLHTHMQESVRQYISFISSSYSNPVYSGRCGFSLIASTQQLPSCYTLFQDQLSLKLFYRLLLVLLA